MAKNEMRAIEEAEGVSVEVTSPAVIDATDEEDEGLVIRLRKPYVFDGKTVTEIDLSGLQEISGWDVILVNREFRGRVGAAINPEFDMEYLTLLAARATGKPMEFFMGLPGNELIPLKNRVFRFFYGLK